MIVETEIVKYDRTNVELEELVLFCLSVAGKNANQTAAALERFLSCRLAIETFPPHYLMGPFQYIRILAEAGILRTELESARLSPYGSRQKGFEALAYSGINLRSCSPDELEAIPGIGPKTARFFIMSTRPNQEYATLDTHILKWLKEDGRFPNVPKSTPSGETYLRWEQTYLTVARSEAELRGITLAQLDLAIWKHYAGRHDGTCLCEGYDA